MNELEVLNQYNYFPSIINYDIHNPVVRSPYAANDLYFYQTKDTLMDVDVFRNFLKNAESRFRACKEYKAYKSYLIEQLGINRCQILGNITTEDADVELHHNILGLFDICLLITSHIINTVGIISTFDLVQMLIEEHKANRVGITFLSSTVHQVYTNSYDSYIPPEMTFGKWWELLERYKYGITYDIASKVIKYINRYKNDIPTSIYLPLNEQILSYASFNEYGFPKEYCGNIPSVDEDVTMIFNSEEEENEYGF